MHSDNVKGTSLKAGTISKLNNAIYVLAVAAITTGCGGGANRAFSDGGDYPAIFEGAYHTVETGFECPIQALVVGPGGVATVVTASGYNELAFGSDSTGYRLCNDQVWVGKFGGSITGASGGTGSAEMTIFTNGGSATGKTGPITGAVGVGSNKKVHEFWLTSTTDSTVKLAVTAPAANTAYFNSIAGSYSTLAGSYFAKSPKDSLSVQADGTLTGTSVLGNFTGTVTAFHPDTQVHDVSITVTYANATTRKLTGVLAPYGAYSGSVPSALPGGDNAPSLMLVVSDGTVAWADVFSKR